MEKVEKIYYYPASVPKIASDYASYIKSELWRLINIHSYKPSLYRDIEEAHYHASHSPVDEKDYYQVIAQILCEDDGQVTILVDNPFLRIREKAYWKYGMTDFILYD